MISSSFLLEGSFSDPNSSGKMIGSLVSVTERPELLDPFIPLLRLFDIFKTLWVPMRSEAHFLVATS